MEWTIEDRDQVVWINNILWTNFYKDSLDIAECALFLARIAAILIGMINIILLFWPIIYGTPFAIAKIVVIGYLALLGLDIACSLAYWFLLTLTLDIFGEYRDDHGRDGGKTEYLFWSMFWPHLKAEYIPDDNRPAVKFTLSA